MGKHTEKYHFVIVPALVCLLGILITAPAALAEKYTRDNRCGDNKITVVSGFAKNVGFKDIDQVVVATVPAGKKFILTDVVADRSVRTFSFSISDKISLSININEYKVDQSPAWHFNSGIPFKAGEKVVVSKVDGSGNVFISGYLVDDK
ncbi:MAG: hypothetical protein ACOZF0_11245 [Thermodesulfobacteriota bacterium]